MKIYKRIIFTETARHDPRLESPEQLAYVRTRAFRVPNLISIPAMILIGVFGALAFSAFFALLLIPVAILAVRTGWILRRLRGNSADQTLEGEYSVITQTSKNDE